jgi:MarR family transcriptional regulator for hemolysin
MICIPVNTINIMPKLDLKDSAGMLVLLASKSQERLAEIAIKKQLGLTPAQWKVIMALSLNDGLAQKELAEKIYIDDSTLVPVIYKMEQIGLVERRVDKKDRRSNRVFLTGKSHSVIDSLALIILQLRKMVYNGIPEKEITIIKNVLKTIIQNSDTAISDMKLSGKDKL